MKAETTEFSAKRENFCARQRACWSFGRTRLGARLISPVSTPHKVFERTANPAKTHSGVRSQFARLTKDEPSFDSELRAFLGRAFNMKAAADYETSAATRVTKTQAAAAIQSATSFVECVSLLITRVDPKT